MPDRGTIGLNVPSLLRSLSQALYRSDQVAIRELLQNGHDACVYFRRELDDDAKLKYRAEVNFKTVRVDGRACVEVTDNGVGMTRETLVSELSVIGASSKDHGLLGKAVEARGGYDERVIGQYGIGFLAAFLIGDRVDVYTKKSDGPAWHWWCEGDADYFVEEIQEPTPRGTRVVVRLKKPEHGSATPDSVAKFSNRDILKRVVSDYAPLLQVPVYVDNIRINVTNRHWSSDQAFKTLPEAEMQAFTRERFQVEFLDFFRVSKRAEDTKIGEIISYRAAFYFGRLDAGEVRFSQGGAMESAGGVDLYVKGMFVGRIHDMLPPWASFVHGIVDVDNLNLGLSREEPQRDALFESVSVSLGRDVIRRLGELRRTDKLAKIADAHRSALLRALMAHGRLSFGDGETLLGAMADVIMYSTTHGTMTLVSYIGHIAEAASRDDDCESNTFYCLAKGTTGVAESLLAQDMGWPVILADPLEDYVIQSVVEVQNAAETRGGARGPTLQVKRLRPDDLFRERTLGERNTDHDYKIVSVFSTQLTRAGLGQVRIKPRSFRNTIPAMLLLDTDRDPSMEALFRQFEAGQGTDDSNRLAGAMRELAQKLKERSSETVFYVNRGNNIVRQIVSLWEANPQDKILDVGCRALYHSSLLQSSHVALDRAHASVVIDNFNEALSMLFMQTAQLNELSRDAAGAVSTRTGHADPLPGTALSRQRDEAAIGNPSYVFFAHSFRNPKVRAAVARAQALCESEHGVVGRSADSEPKALRINESVRHYIANSLFVVADITGNNPNVMIEIGLAEALGKKVLLMRDKQDDSKFPIDLADAHILEYEIFSSEDGSRHSTSPEFDENCKAHLLLWKSAVG